MRSFTKFDRQIEQAILQKAEKISPSENMFEEINKNINIRSKEGYYMRNPKRIRGIMIACILIAVTTVTCFAASQIVSITGYAENNFESYPSHKQMKKVAGFLPKYEEEFENGYRFKEAFVGELEGKNAGEGPTTMIKCADFTYTTGDAKLYLYTMEEPKNSVKFPVLQGDKVTLTDEQTVFYYDYLNKLKPVDYVMTKQDKIDEANGTYVFSFGEDYDCIKHIQMVDWQEDGIRYSLNCLDDKLTKDELLKMVEEIIK